MWSVADHMTGLPLGDLQILPGPAFRAPDCQTSEVKSGSNITEKQKLEALRTPTHITFVRNRMMYARAALNAQGGVRFGLRHIRKCTLLEYFHFLECFTWLTR